MLYSDFCACEENQLTLLLHNFTTSQTLHLFITTATTAMMMMRRRTSTAAVAPAAVANVPLDVCRGDVGSTEEADPSPVEDGIGGDSGSSKEGRKLVTGF